MSIIKRFFTKDLANRVSKPCQFLQVLVGPRQVGKTTALHQIKDSWNDSVVMESAEGPESKGYEWIQFHWQRARQFDSPVLLIFDEIQNIEKWQEVVKIQFDAIRNREDIRIVLTGSASLKIQKGMQESLAGRFEVIRAPHWGFDEYSSHFNWNLTQYLQFGGYPAASALIHDVKRWQDFIRESIIDAVLSKDIQQIANIQKPALLRQLFTMCLSLPAQEISYQKLLGQLQDQGNAATIKHYLEILSGAFLIASLEKYSPKQLKMRSSSPKIIPLCPALIHGYTQPQRILEDANWRGRVVEAAVGAHLLQSRGTLSYWRDGNLEVDYILEIDQAVYAIEVKSGRRKGLKGLQKFCEKFPEAHPIILNGEKIETLLKSRPVDETLLSKLM